MMRAANVTMAVKGRLEFCHPPFFLLYGHNSLVII